MDRRKFFSRVAAGIAGAAAGTGLAKAGLNLAGLHRTDCRTVVYDVKGFTCVTCAFGLEAMLLRQPGVTKAVASYPDATVMISFDENLTSQEALKDLIASCGFTAG